MNKVLYLFGRSWLLVIIFVIKNSTDFVDDMNLNGTFPSCKCKCITGAIPLPNKTDAETAVNSTLV